jgi:hypothetical protein
MANAVTVAPYGKWDSPITAEYLSGDSIHFEGIQSNVSHTTPELRLSYAMTDPKKKKSHQPDNSLFLSHVLQKAEDLLLSS